MRCLAVLVALSAPAFADPAFDPNARTWLGADLEMLPEGSLHQTAGFGQVSDAPAATAYALGFLLEQRVSDAVGIAFAPRVLWDIGPADAVSSASSQASAPTGKQLDLRLRVAYGTDLSPRTRFFVFASPGYAIGFEPSGVNTLHPHGAIAGAGAGVYYALDKRLALTIDVGYQWGFQSYQNASNAEIRDRTQYMHIALGIAGAHGGPPQIPPAPPIAAR